MILRCPKCKLVLLEKEYHGCCPDCQTKMKSEWRLMEWGNN